MNDRPDDVNDVPLTAAPPDEFATQSHPRSPSGAPRADVFGNFPAIPGYEILSELGRGGMGVVYRAQQMRANREVALKMILSGEWAGSAEVARFQVEAEAVARLQHTNVVAVFEVGEHAGLPFFTMEYCPGGSLAALAKSHQFSAREAGAMVLKLAHGVAAAHAVGIVHRDLKPANVLLTADGEPKISDFGLAKQLTGADAGRTGSGAVLGTPSYMSPEQAFGDSKHVGPAADVYALGAILYELLAHRPPFIGPTPTDIIVRVVSEDLEPVRIHRPDVPHDLEAVCLKCLEKDPRKRYASASELADELGRFLEGEPVSAVQSGMLGQLVGALDRVQLQDRFADYGTMLLALAPVMLLPDLFMTLIVWNDWPWIYQACGQIGRFAAFLLVVAYFRKGRWRPQGQAERHLFAVWGGYVACCAVLGPSLRLATGFANGYTLELELQLYQPLACLTALAFFAQVASIWGYHAVMAVIFLLLVLVMAIDLRFAPLEFGLTWAVMLVVMGLRLRSLKPKS